MRKHIFTIILCLFCCNIFAYNKLSYNVYIGYSLGLHQDVSHGMNIGGLCTANNFMLGIDTKISLSDPAAGNHSWGAYGVLGYKGKYFGIGAMIGGCEIYNEPYYTHYAYDNIYGQPYYYYNPEATYKRYTSLSRFDGGLLMILDIPSVHYGGCSIAISTTYYTPISISLGVYFRNY